MTSAKLLGFWIPPCHYNTYTPYPYYHLLSADVINGSPLRRTHDVSLYGSVSGSERAQAQLIFDRTISRFMFVRPAQQRIQKEIVFCHNLQATNIVHLSKSLPSLPVTGVGYVAMSVH